MLHLGEEEVFSVAEVATAIKGKKSARATGGDKIIAKVLKAPNGEGIAWITRVRQVT